MRTDQYIGLTRPCAAFVGTYLHRVGMYSIEGAFYNDIPLAVYVANDPFDSRYVYMEIVEHTPWDSGPMYYTRLVKFLPETPNTDEFVEFIGNWRNEDIWKDLEGEIEMKYHVFEISGVDNKERPAKYPEYRVNATWNRNVYDTLKDAQDYAAHWLGVYCPDNYRDIFTLDFPYSYNGYGDCIVIRRGE